MTKSSAASTPSKKTSEATPTQPQPAKSQWLTTSFKWLRRAYVGFTVALGSYILLVTVVMLSLLSSGGSDVEQMPLQEEVIRAGSSDSQDIVAVVDLSGPIVLEDTSDDFAFSSVLVSAEKVISILSQLEENDQVKAIVLKINSPGGSAVASDVIYQKLMSIREAKPVTAYFAEVAGSGGYYVGAGANKIVSHPDALTGSIGVIMNLYEVSELYQTLGITNNTIKSGQFKDIGSESRELSDQEREQLQTLVDGTYGSFVNAIVAGRNMDEATVRELGDGRLYSGTQALENGLVDATGTFDDALDMAIADADLSDPAVIEYLDQSFFESLFSANMMQILPGVGSLLHKVTPHQQAGLMYLMDI